MKFTTMTMSLKVALCWFWQIQFLITICNKIYDENDAKSKLLHNVCLQDFKEIRDDNCCIKEDCKMDFCVFVSLTNAEWWCPLTIEGLKDILDALPLSFHCSSWLHKAFFICKSEPCSLFLMKSWPRITLSFFLIYQTSWVPHLPWMSLYMAPCLSVIWVMIITEPKYQYRDHLVD